MCYCDYESPAVYVRETRKARKSHRCYECGAQIEPGVRYEHVFGVWDGQAGSNSTCLHCVELRIWAESKVEGLCWAHGSMLDDIQACLFECEPPAAGVRFGWLRRIHADVVRARRLRRQQKAAA